MKEFQKLQFPNKEKHKGYLEIVIPSSHPKLVPEIRYSGNPGPIEKTLNKLRAFFSKRTEKEAVFVRSLYARQIAAESKMIDKFLAKEPKNGPIFVELLEQIAEQYVQAYDKGDSYTLEPITVSAPYEDGELSITAQHQHRETSWNIVFRKEPALPLQLEIKGLEIKTGFIGNSQPELFLSSAAAHLFLTMDRLVGRAIQEKEDDFIDITPLGSATDDKLFRGKYSRTLQDRPGLVGISPREVGLHRFIKFSPKFKDYRQFETQRSSPDWEESQLARDKDVVNAHTSSNT